MVRGCSEAASRKGKLIATDLDLCMHLLEVTGAVPSAMEAEGRLLLVHLPHPRSRHRDRRGDARPHPVQGGRDPHRGTDVHHQPALPRARPGGERGDRGDRRRAADRRGLPGDQGWRIRVHREYLDAKETVLVLQGPPGTGKTRFIRAILGEISRRNEGEAQVLYTGDMKALETRRDLRQAYKSRTKVRLFDREQQTRMYFSFSSSSRM
jgi:hypothetical protein